MGQEEAPSSWNGDAEPKKRMRSHRAIPLTSVMSKWYATCRVWRLEREKEPEEWNQPHVGGVDGVSSQHFLVTITQLLEERRLALWRKKRCTSPAWTSRRPSMWHDRSRCRKNSCRTGYPRMNYSFCYERWSLRWQTTFENVEKSFQLHEMHPQRKCRSGNTVTQIGSAHLMARGRGLVDETGGDPS